ncbi:MAG: TIGR00303 family protein [Synergistota bacterium]|nr:TIGR00303 family protein [Synergistota bacterium]
MFILVAGGTDIGKIPGISVAGSNPEVLPYTAPADADLLWWGETFVTDAIPVDPEGHPTPALITRAARVLADFPTMIVRAGTYLPPVCPFFETGAEPGGDPRTGPSVPQASRLWDAGFSLGRLFSKMNETIVIAETIPGGTTSAFMALRALGHDGMVSSAGPQNPVSLKEQMWTDVAKRLGVQPGGMKGRGLDVVREIGDPMQAVAGGLVAGALGNAQVVLAGGTQMLAVAALVRDIGLREPMTVATTRYVIEDASADFEAIATSVKADTWAARLDFSESPFPGLADYERGYVKEGVGAGGAVWYAEKFGVSCEEVALAVGELYRDMTGFTPSGDPVSDE